MTESSSSHWIGLLQSPKAFIRLEAARNLADLQAPDTCDALAEALKRENKRSIKAEIGVALAIQGDRRGMPGLLAAVERGRPTDLTAIALLGRMGDAKALEAMQRARNRFFLHPLVRVRLTASMAALGDASAQRELLYLSSSGRVEVRHFALELMGELACQVGEYMDRLSEVASNPADTGRWFAIKALHACGETCGRAREILERILRSGPLDEEDMDEARELGLEGLGLCPPQKSMDQRQS